MIVLDHDIPRDQADRLRLRRIRFRQIGIQVGRPEWDDQQEILRYLQQTRDVTFLTRDVGFFRPRFRHANYCIAVVDDIIAATATTIRRFLRHPQFRTNSMRVGRVVRLSPTKITLWEIGRERPYSELW